MVRKSDRNSIEISYSLLGKFYRISIQIRFKLETKYNINCHYNMEQRKKSINIVQEFVQRHTLAL